MRAVVLLLLSSLFTPFAAADDLSGTYTGTYQSLVGSGNCAFSSSGTTTIAITQTGTSASVNIVFRQIKAITHAPSCTTQILDYTVSVPSTVNGDSLSGSNTAGESLGAGLSGGTLFGTVSSTQNVPLSVSFSATRDGGTPSPGSDFSGTWSGTLSGVIECASGPVSPAFPTVATLHQTGAVVTGSVSMTGADPCTGGSPATRIFAVNGTATGSYFIAPFPSQEDGLIIGVLNGDGSMSFGIITVDDEVGEIALTGILTGGNSPPAALSINSFAASPPSIRAGQSATLSWSVRGATSVTIDNGIGTVGATGSIAVSPSANVTYTLTAIQGTSTVTSTATVTVLSGPIVNVVSIPAPMLQLAGVTGGITSYALTNSGSAPASVTLTQRGSFFTQSPSSFTLAPGATQVVTITGIAQPSGSFEGASIVSGSGVPSGLEVVVKLLSAPPPAGTVTAEAPAPRVGVAAGPGTSPSGTVSFTNHGNSTLTGILTADVPWIVPQSGVVTILPGQTATFTFTCDRSKRPDSETIGSVEGNIILTFLGGAGSSFAKGPFADPPTVPSVAIVRIVDTVQPVVTTGGIPVLTAGEVALFVAGAGHTVSANGDQQASDLNVLNSLGGRAIDDVKMYYTALSGSTAAAKTTSLGTMPGQISVAVADVVKNIFSGANEVGTVQIRSRDADKLRVSAKAVTVNNAAGIFGNAIPVLRSDRAVEATGALVLTGLRKDATTQTNLYVQEVAGSAATIQTEFLAANGTTVSTRSDTIDAFKLLQLVNAVPNTAVAAVVTNTSTAGGKIAAYATPVDGSSSDTYAIADWSRQLGYAATEPVVIPIAGSVHGSNNAFFRTDVAITNRGTSSASATFRFVSRNGVQTDRTVTLAAKQTSVITDVIETLFNISGDAVGYLIFTPASGSFALTSRTFTTTGSPARTYSTGVPVVASASAIRSGGSRPIAGIADATRTTVNAARPGSVRTNFGLMETTGQTAKVRVTFRFTFPAGEKSQGVGSASRDYVLSGNQFMLLNSIAGELLGPARLQFGDLSNVQTDFQVIDGVGGVMVFTSSVDNATGDSILRMD
jgi:hypothetical protein